MEFIFSNKYPIILGISKILKKNLRNVIESRSFLNLFYIITQLFNNVNHECVYFHDIEF